MENIAILGSTGSIGCSTLDVVRRMRSRFRVIGLAAGDNVTRIRKQVEEFQPKIVSVRSISQAEKLRQSLGDSAVQVVFGEEGAEEVAGFSENDIVVSAITGFSGLKPTLAAVRQGKKVALANKESMVVAGPLIQSEASASGARIIPVDSEHSGIFQCLAKERREGVKKVTLTASGGPFFNSTLSDLEHKTLEEALSHPRWKMGKKVTIDSATLMNKGLELIEARWLFGLEPRQLHILIHPQSIIHSLVEMRDGSVLAQLSLTDMKIPIQYALTFPRREDSSLPSLDLGRVRVLEFFEVDEKRFPLVGVARQALAEGDSTPVSLNAANEVAVSEFLKRRIKFTDIAAVVRQVMEGHEKRPALSLEEILEVDRQSRAETETVINRRI